MAALQEVDVNRQSAAGSAHAWRQKGFCTSFGAPDLIGWRQVWSPGLCKATLRMCLGFPADLPRTSAAYESMMRQLLCTVVYSWCSGISTVFSTVSTSLIRSADEACLGTPATTKPLGTRRIDFALAHPDLVACREHLLHLAVSDHCVVCVDSCAGSHKASLRKPSFC